MSFGKRGHVAAWGVGLCLSAPALAHAQVRPTASTALADWTYTVRPGDNLWTLGRTLLARPNDWPQIQRLNRLSSDRLAPGMRLRIPLDLLRVRPAPARVVDTGGTATVFRLDGSRASLVVGATLYVGDAVETGNNGSASIAFADESTLLVSASSRVVFDRLSGFGATGMVDTRVRLERGRARPSVKPGRGRFEMWSPSLQVITRGTEFRVEAANAGATGRVEVTESAVDAVAGGATVLVPEGSGTVARGGAAPGPPVPLLPAPNAAQGAAPFRRVPVRLTMPAVAGASGYHWEVGVDTAMTRLAADSTTTAPTVQLPDLPDGAYVVRARAVDGQGLEGFDGTAPFVIDARPEAPILITPPPAAVLRDERPTFAWAQPADAVGFHVQVASTPQFDTLVVDAGAVTGPTFSPQAALAPGSYVWRVATRLASGEEGPFGDAQPFLIRRLPARPTPGEAVIGGDAVVLGWPAADESGARYHVQVATDDQFSVVTADRTITEPQLSLPRPQSGRYFVRVRTIEADGFEGAFGPVQLFDVPIVAQPAPPPAPHRRRVWPWVLGAIGGAVGVVGALAW